MYTSNDSNDLQGSATDLFSDKIRRPKMNYAQERAETLVASDFTKFADEQPFSDQKVAMSMDNM